MKISIKSQTVLKKGRKKAKRFCSVASHLSQKHLNYKNITGNFLRN